MTKFAEGMFLPVVLAVWKRLPLLDRTLYQLAHQQGVRPMVYVLNNNPDIKDEVEHEVRRYRGRLRISVRHSDNSLSCFGRFNHARQIKNGSRFLAFIDDDQVFSNTFLATLWAERIKGGITASHAFQFCKNRDYWQRRRIQAGQRADYCGPGGMIIDSRLLDQHALFRGPAEALIMDDIWLSYVANHVLGVPVRKSSTSVQMIDSARDTWPTIYQKKIDFLNDLRSRGWRV